MPKVQLRCDPLGCWVLLWRRFWVAVGLGAALSGMIEAIQSTIPTRATDVDDLLFNTIGTALGAALLIWHRRSR